MLGSFRGHQIGCAEPTCVGVLYFSSPCLTTSSMFLQLSAQFGCNHCSLQKHSAALYKNSARGPRNEHESQPFDGGNEALSDVASTGYISPFPPQRRWQTNLGIELLSTPDMAKWEVDVEVPDPSNPLYRDQKFRLSFIFPDNYPFESPQVQFITAAHRQIPMHPHIYSNGHICLDVLGDGWTPVLNTQALAVSIQSMLAGNTKNERPPGDADYCRTCPSNPKHSRYLYDDDTV